jgi:hypothetical protein
VLSFTNAAGQSLQGSQQIALLQFSALPGQPTVMAPLVVDSVQATRTNGTLVSDAVGAPGAVEILNQQPLLLAFPGAGGQNHLTLYGFPGTNYSLEYATSMTPPVNWQVLQQIIPTNLTQAIELPIPSAGTNAIFYRLELTNP